MKYITLTFALKDQPFESLAVKIYELVGNLEKEYGKKIMLIHNFPPQATKVVDLFNELFPNRQLDCYDEDVTGMRLNLLSTVRYFKADVYVIGEEYASVVDDVAQYEASGIKVRKITL